MKSHYLIWSIELKERYGKTIRKQNHRKCLTGSFQFFISIIDINNRKPIVDEFQQQVIIYENATSGLLLGEIKAHDDDRDSTKYNWIQLILNIKRILSSRST